MLSLFSSLGVWKKEIYRDIILLPSLTFYLIVVLFVCHRFKIRESPSIFLLFYVGIRSGGLLVIRLVDRDEDEDKDRSGGDGNGDCWGRFWRHMKDRIA